MEQKTKTITDTILMIRPNNFGYNPETAKNNSFQSDESELSNEEISKLAQTEFDFMVSKLKKEGINILVIEDTNNPIKPDAVFPNNWFSTHSNGVYVSYPMHALSRRAERREDIYDLLNEKYSFKKKYTFEFYEEEEQFLEGTGSLILDRTNRILYACLSPRTDIRLVEKFCILMDFEKIVFHAHDRNGQQVYHTNVMMALGTSFVVICMECVKDADDKKALLSSFEKTYKSVIEISLSQMEQFAGNMIQVDSMNGSHLVMSQTAYDSLEGAQILELNKHTNLISIPIPTIEKHGGGSVRCMMAEIFPSV